MRPDPGEVPLLVRQIWPSNFTRLYHDEEEKANKQGVAGKERDGGDEEQGDEQLELRDYANMPVQASPVATASLLPWR